MNNVSCHFQYHAYGVKSTSTTDGTELIFPKIQLTADRQTIKTAYEATFLLDSTAGLPAEFMRNFLENNPEIDRGEV